ncbi:MAG: murein biosynthesis integral membrane protein MurJ [Planctomycetota bacterium]
MSEADRQAEPTTRGEQSLGGGVRTVGGLTLISRVLGLVRDLLLVRVFGNTAVGSAFAAAFAIPNVFRRLFGEGALSAAFLPEYTRLHRDDPEVAHRFATRVVLALALGSSALLVVLELALLGVLFAIGGDPDRAFAIGLVMLLLPFMPLVCVAAALGGVLHVHGRFAPAAAAPVLLNLFMITGGAWHFATGAEDPRRSAQVIGVLAVVSGVAQVGWSLWALRGRVRWTLVAAGVSGPVRTMLTRFVPVLIGLGTIQLNSLLDTLIAMYPNYIGPTLLGRDYPLTVDANAVLFFTQRLYQFPLGVFGIAVATVIFPLLARASDSPSSFISTVRSGLRLSLFISLPATAGLIAVREPLIATLFSGGVGAASGFDDSGVERASAVLLGYGVAVWAYSLNHVLARAFYALGDTRSPMRIAIVVVFLNTALNLMLIWPLGEAGLAWATGATAVLQTFWLGVSLRKKLGTPLFDAESVRSIARSAAGGLACGAGAALCVLWTPGMLTGLGAEAGAWHSAALTLAAAVIAGVGVYGLLSIRRPELRSLLSRG